MLDFSKLPGTFGRDVDSDWFPWPFEGAGAEQIRFKIRRSDHPEFLQWAREVDSGGVMTKAGAKASKLMTIAEVRTGFREKKKAKADPEAEKKRAQALLAEAYEKALSEQPDEAFVQLGDPHLPAVGAALYRVETIEGIDGGDRPALRLALFGFEGVLTPEGKAITTAQLAKMDDAFRSRAAGDPNFDPIQPGGRYDDGTEIVILEGKYAGLTFCQALIKYVGECAEELKERRESLFTRVSSDLPGSDACSGAPSAA